MDYDGVLTDGAVRDIRKRRREESFNARDGQGMSLFQRAGWKTGIISGRKSSAVETPDEWVKRIGYLSIDWRRLSTH